jgi:uncharacterized protein YndB with AHSA1/START domain
MTVAVTTDQVYSLFIRATPQQVWDAITKPEFTTQYFYGSVIDSTFEPGAPYVSTTADGTTKLTEGEILEADPPRKLSQTWRSLWDEAAAAEQPSRVTWEIEAQEDGTTKLTVTHDLLDDAPVTAAGVAGGWSYVLSGLKTLLETGAPLAG